VLLVVKGDLLKFEKELFNKKKILNVGCGSDNFGTDYIDFYCVRKDVIKVDVNTDKFPYSDNIFDFVYSRCNFEHLSNPSNFINESYRTLKTGGYLLLVTDNANYLGYIFSDGHHFSYKGYGVEDLHYGLYTPEHLVTHFRKKFEIIESGYLDVDILPWRNELNGLNIIKRIFSLFAKINIKYFKRAFSRRVYIVARKKGY
jgi:SAM-dependent methyltransferase